MAEPAPDLTFNTAFEPETGSPVEILPGLVRVTAPNAGPFTFTGTNTYLAGTTRLAIIDPGPRDEAHLAALISAIAGRPVEAIILTHTHRDHCAMVPALRELAGGPPLWFAGKHRLYRRPSMSETAFIANAADFTLKPDRVLADGQQVVLNGLTLDVVATPGHCANHLAFGIAGTDTLISGDHVMGWNSTLISVPDGSLGDYLGSLDRLMMAPYRRYLPGHGGPIEDGPKQARGLKIHREMRNGQILAAIGNGARTVGALLRAVYPGIALAIIPAASMTIVAHLEYLADREDIEMSRSLFTGIRVRPR